MLSSLLVPVLSLSSSVLLTLQYSRASSESAICPRWTPSGKTFTVSSKAKHHAMTAVELNTLASVHLAARLFNQGVTSRPGNHLSPFVFYFSQGGSSPVLVITALSSKKDSCNTTEHVHDGFHLIFSEVNLGKHRKADHLIGSAGEDYCCEEAGMRPNRSSFEMRTSGRQDYYWAYRFKQRWQIEAKGGKSYE